MLFLYLHSEEIKKVKKQTISLLIIFSRLGCEDNFDIMHPSSPFQYEMVNFYNSVLILTSISALNISRNTYFSLLYLSANLLFPPFR